MFGFLSKLFGARKKGSEDIDHASEESHNSRPDNSEVSDTFVEATGGGWRDLPETVPADGGNQADYVESQLKKATIEAYERGLVTGDSFRYRLTDIPKDISSPHEIAFGMMLQASKYGMIAGAMRDEEIHLTLFENP